MNLINLFIFRFKGKWLKNKIFGNGCLKDISLNKSIKGFWINNTLYFDFELNDVDDFTDEVILERVKSFMSPLQPSNEQ